MKRIATVEIVLVLLLCTALARINGQLLNKCHQSGFSKVASVQVQALYANHIALVHHPDICNGAKDGALLCKFSYTTACALFGYSLINRTCFSVIVKKNNMFSNNDIDFTANTNLEIWKNSEFQSMFDQLQLSANITAVFKNSLTGRNGTIQTFVVTVKGCYNITAKGAKGGPHLNRGTFGGFGAIKQASFQLNVGTMLLIVVGQMGGPARATNSDDGSGGGGGTFVYRAGDNYLLLAAGGGGGVRIDTARPGESATNGSDSIRTGSEEYTGFGGSNGNAGSVGPDYTTGNDGGAGAGWLNSAPPRRDTKSGSPGRSLADGWLGGEAGDATGFEGVGGFGGGGGAAGTVSGTSGCAGAGGGYSGGGAGSKLHTGGGGGSYAAPEAFRVNGITGGNPDDHGEVTIHFDKVTC